MTVDWEGLKALEALEREPVVTPGIRLREGIEFRNALVQQFPSMLAEHERSQRVIAAAQAFRKSTTEANEQELFAALAEFDKAKQP